jgi:hypothetical protein
MYSTTPIHWNIKSAPASPGRSRVGPAFYVFSFLGSHRLCSFRSGGGGEHCTVLTLLRRVICVWCMPLILILKVVFFIEILTACDALCGFVGASQLLFTPQSNYVKKPNTFRLLFKARPCSKISSCLWNVYSPSTAFPADFSLFFLYL